MTREEAISVLHKIKPTLRRADGKSTTHILETIALDLAIKALEQEPCDDISKKERWIPCSERLPEDFQRVLVTVVNYKGHEVVRVAEYYKMIFQIKENHEQWEVGEKGLLAWMPLPEPYKAETEREE